jgi:hypothetical protein
VPQSFASIACWARQLKAGISVVRGIVAMQQKSSGAILLPLLCDMLKFLLTRSFHTVFSA